MRIVIAVIASLAPAIAAADPQTIAITSSKLSHSSVPTLAAGPPGFAVVWEEKAPSGPDHRHIAAAIVDASGKLAVKPTRLLDGGDLPNDLVAAWNGKAFTIVVCNGAWDGKHKAVWGELAADGTFTRLGEQTFAASETGFSCGAPVVKSDRVTFVAADQLDGYNDADERTSRDCKAWRVTLDGAKATVGKPAKLCRVIAADTQWILGFDPTDRAVFVDEHHRATGPKKLDAHGAIAIAGKFVVGTNDDDALLAVAWLEPPFKKVARKTVLQGSPIGAVQEPSLVALRSGRLAALARTPTGLEGGIFDATGALLWKGTVTTTPLQYSACSSDDAGLFCVWTDDDRKFQGEVRAVRIANP
jgi:hypothetical protein